MIEITNDAKSEIVIIDNGNKKRSSTYKELVKV